MHLSQNHAQAILDVFAVAISDLVSMGMTEQDAISGLLGQASVRADHPAMELALELHRLYHKDFSSAKTLNHLQIISGEMVNHPGSLQCFQL